MFTKWRKSGNIAIQLWWFLDSSVQCWRPFHLQNFRGQCAISGLAYHPVYDRQAAIATNVWPTVDPPRKKYNVPNPNVAGYIVLTIIWCYEAPQIHWLDRSNHVGFHAMDGSNPDLQEDRQRYEATSERRHQSCCRSVLYIVRCPAAKTVTGEITASKYRSLFPSDTFLSHNVARWQKNAFDAACKCWSTSCRFLITVGILNMQRSHLWHDCWSRISICKPAGVDRNDGGWASVVITCHHLGFVCVQYEADLG